MRRRFSGDCFCDKPGRNSPGLCSPGLPGSDFGDLPKFGNSPVTRILQRAKEFPRRCQLNFRSMLTYLIWGIGYGFAAAMQPGQFQAYLMAQTLRQGWRKTLPMIFAPLLSDGPVIVIVLFALSRLPVWWLPVLRFAGGLFALYLAAGTFRAWRDFRPVQENQSSGVGWNLFRAALVNLLNPGPYLFWSLVTGPLLLSGWQETPLNGIGLLAGFYMAVIVTLAGFILLCSGSGKLGPRATRHLLGISGLALAAFGLYQIGSVL